MCDTLVAVGNSTEDGSVIFAKNSDREPNESQWFIYLPPESYPAGTKVNCTYIDIPQVEKTYGIMLSQPFWLWGGEMGANDQGVVIGNEAVFTKEPYAKTGLVGMDLIRLALERANNARNALDVIVNLIATYGQGGNCKMHGKLYYHNSFIIADPREAWVLETAGQHWGAKKVKDVASISNSLTLGSDLDLMSQNLIKHAVDKKWCSSEKNFHFAANYSDPLYSFFSAGKIRQQCSMKWLQKANGRINCALMMNMLRDHGDHKDWYPGHKGMKTICMHAGGLIYSQSTASLVAHIRNAKSTYWATASSAPCTSLFKPCFMELKRTFGQGPKPDQVFHPQSFWWQHEKIHRWAIQDYPARIPHLQTEQQRLENEFHTKEQALLNYLDSKHKEQIIEALDQFTKDCLQKAQEFEHRWTEFALKETSPSRLPFFQQRLWKKLNRKAQLI